MVLVRQMPGSALKTLMKKPSAFRFWAPAILLGASAFAPFVLPAAGQVGQSAMQSLLDKAHALEVRGRLDMASQTWQQVLLADPNNTEALGGLARAAKSSGNQTLSNNYVDRLRAINPNDPGIARAETMGTLADHNAQLQLAGKYAQQGQYAQAMETYRKVYGNTPPAGEASLAFYETESATEDGRPHAIAGLRSLVEKYPSDSRYQVALGRILTYNPKTRPEGRKFLAAHPSDPQAVDALRQSLLWDAQNPATASDIKAYLARHNDAQLALALRSQPRVQSAPTRGSRSQPVPISAEERAANAVNATRNAEDQAAYRALNAKHLDEAEKRFQAVLVQSPSDANALAGMGYIRMQQANFGGALSFLTQAKQDGSKDLGLEAALATSRFWYTMGEGAIALNENDLPLAEKQYRSALGMRPASVEALEGLGGTLLKAQQPEAAVPYFAQFVKIKPSAAHAWRGLFLAQFGAGDAVRALQTERQLPATVRTQLFRDPLFLRALASAYSAVGRDADAQRVLRSALDLPFPADARGLEAETQIQYAGLLQQANHVDQAAGLYQQVLARDQNNLSAWQGLVRTEHAMGKDPEAMQTVESMPPDIYAKAMRVAGFDATVASIYQTLHRLDVAQDILEYSIAQQTAAGQKPSVPAQVQLAGIYLERNNPQQAYLLYSQVIAQNPDRTEAWKGLISSLHSTGRETEALAQVQQIPPATRAQLENDPEFLQNVGAVYNALGQPQQAQLFLRRVQEHYARQHTAPPADIDVQDAWLLFNGGNDAGLYRQLLNLGGRNDLTDQQRRTVQTIWANWAVRRANQAAAAGNNQRALSILNATARAFPDNPGVIKALAGGYARAGLPKQAVLIWKAQDMTAASVSDYRAAVGAALSANDTKDAETWLRFGLDQNPKDADLLIFGAKFEQARGDNSRAADYYRASLEAMPPSDPGAELANELSRPVPAASTQIPTARYGQDLATLLAPGMNDANNAMQANISQQSTQPYLPGSPGSSLAPVQMRTGTSQMNGQPMYGQTPMQSTYDPAMNQQGMAPQYGNGSPVVPSYMTAPTPRTRTSQPSGSRTRLRDYVPQASLDEILPLDATELPATAVVDTGNTMDSFGPVTTPALYQQAQIARLTARIYTPDTPAAEDASLTLPQELPAQAATLHNRHSQPLTEKPVSQMTLAQNAQRMPPPPQQTTMPLPAQQKPASLNPGSTEVYGAYVPYQGPAAVPVQLGSTPTVREIAKPEVTDVLPTARYVPNARVNTTRTSHPDLAAADAAAQRRKQANQPLSGQSRPPVEEYVTPVTDVVQYTPTPQNNAQTLQPSRRSASDTASSSMQPPVQQPPVQQTGDSNGQQYPQPNTARMAPRGRVRASRSPAAVVEAKPMPLPGMSYPGVGQALTYQPYPTIGSAYPLGAAPTDADLMAKRVPPLRGSYYTGKVLAPALPLTQREQTERDLAMLEASYSGWLGGTGSARYRSGTVGLDRLTDLETTFEASATVGNSVRFTIVPRAVFLNSGVLDNTQYAGLTAGVPVLGTLQASAINAPTQQYASGIGGEFQVAGRNFAAAVGYTPYEFLVRNITGRILFKAGQHFTFYANRDSVVETQLSYAGLRDPGTATAVYGGNIWGGVIATGGGFRYDVGDQRAGFYVTADGADLTGYHVLENNKFEGSMGAYFLAHTFPGYGRLNIGGSLFGMHYAYNERGLSYGNGGYFSPEAYFLASIPITFAGRYRNNFHYNIAGSAGVQTFQEDNALFFPLDRGIQNSFTSTANNGLPCLAVQIANHTCAQYSANSNTGGNYGVNAEGAFRIAEHWYAGGFASANNTNNYNTVTGGFFIRYLFRPQFGTDDYPTGLFPVEGFRPLRVP